MKIKSVHIRDFRCLRDVFIPCDPLTVLVGRNGVGKSCILNALTLFYNTDIKISERDFYNNDTSQDISITICFSDLNEIEKKLFKPYLEGDELSIEKVIQYDKSKVIQKYHGTRYKNPEFEPFRNSSGAALKEEYNKLRNKDEYREFPTYKNKESSEIALEEWELNNKDKCKRYRDDGQFFGFQNVGRHRLEKYTKFIHIPAVHEASVESVEERGSIFEEIMEIVVKSALSTNEDLIRLQTEAQQKYAEIIDPSKNPNLKDLAKKLTTTMKYYVPDTEVNIRWIEETGVKINVPRAYVTLKEGGYENTVDRCGHGLQRAYILSMFQELAFIQASASLESEKTTSSGNLQMPSLIIGIEEPELYQHPDRQRYFSKILLQLSSRGIEGAFENIQVIHSTHSPLMIDFLRFNELRIVTKRKPTEEDKPDETQSAYTSLSEVSSSIEKAKGLAENSIRDEMLRQRLIPLMTPWMNEGFFANLVVLVEGIRDRSLILGEALSKNYDFESMGICVIPCTGKDSMTEAISIYKCLRIPTYVVWDSDEGKKEGITANRNILRSHGYEPEDYPCRLTDGFCCTRTNLEQTFREEIGNDFYDRTVHEYCQERDIGKPSYAIENHYIMSELILLFKKNGRHSSTLTKIVDTVVKRYSAIETK